MTRPAALAPWLIALVVGCAGPPAVPPTAAPSPAPAPALPGGEAPSTARLDDWIDHYVSALGAGEETRAFRGEVLVAREGQVVAHLGYRGPVGRRYRIGSVTKPFTAVAILQLAAAGKLSLDDELRAHVPELPATYDGVTLAGLLAHRGGVGNYTEDEGLMEVRAEPQSRASMIARIGAMPLHAPPGQGYRYSNSGYFLLGVVVERVSGASWADYLAEHVFAPAGMKSTSTTVDGTVPGLTVEKGALVRAHAVDPSVPFSAGSLSSTGEDLLRFALALRDDTLLPDEWRDEMWVDRGGPAEGIGYGYGWILREREGVKTVGHNGGIDGFTSTLEMTRGGDWVVVALSHLDSVMASDAAGPAMRMAITGKPLEPPRAPTSLAFDPALGEALAGRYLLLPEVEKKARKLIGDAVVDSLRAATVTAEGAYVFAPEGQGPLEMNLGEDGALFHEGLGVRITFERGSDGGHVERLVVQQGGLTLIYQRVAEAR